MKFALSWWLFYQSWKMLRRVAPEKLDFTKPLALLIYAYGHTTVQSEMRIYFMGCFRIEWFSSVLSLIQLFFRKLKINFKWAHLLKKSLKNNLRWSVPWKPWYHQNATFWLFFFNDLIMKFIFFKVFFYRIECILFVSHGCLVSYTIFPPF